MWWSSSWRSPTVFETEGMQFAADFHQWNTAFCEGKHRYLPVVRAGMKCLVKLLQVLIQAIVIWNKFDRHRRPLCTKWQAYGCSVVIATQRSPAWSKRLKVYESCELVLLDLLIIWCAYRAKKTPGSPLGGKITKIQVMVTEFVKNMHDLCMAHTCSAMLALLELFFTMIDVKFRDLAIRAYYTTRNDRDWVRNCIKHVILRCFWLKCSRLIISAAFPFD